MLSQLIVVYVSDDFWIIFYYLLLMNISSEFIFVHIVYSILFARSWKYLGYNLLFLFSQVGKGLDSGLKWKELRFFSLGVLEDKIFKVPDTL